MIFSDFYKGARSPLARLRIGNTKSPTDSPDWVAQEYADLLSKDKTKQKEAIRRYLSDKVRHDWDFDWSPSHARANQGLNQTSTKKSDKVRPEATPPAAIPEETDDGYQIEHDDDDDDDDDDNDDNDNDSGAESDAESIYSIVSHDSLHYRPRAEWASDLNDEADVDSSIKQNSQSSLHLAALARQAESRRALRQEASWNTGLACFEARRNAWTGAKTVRVRSKPAVTAPLSTVHSSSPRSPRRFFFRRSISSSPPSAATALATTNTTTAVVDLSATVSDSSSFARDAHDLPKTDCHADTNAAINTPATSTDEALSYPVQTLVPLAQPLLPPSNPLRASISPLVYLGLYDKVILQNLQPSCPINLADMLRSCVCGWKRDGEWPPRSTPQNPPVAKKRTTPPKPKKQSATMASPATAAWVTQETDVKSSRRLSFNLLGRDGGDESRAGRGFRRSLQRAFGIVPVPGLDD